MNILVLCTGNSARSILLESIFNTVGGNRVTAYSAGCAPTGIVHPQSIRLLSRLGHDVRDVRSKSWDEFAGPDAPKMDIVITVCGSAAHENCPLWPGTPVRSHWGVDDPAAAAQSDREQAFQHAFAILKLRAQALLNMEFEAMDGQELKLQLDRIGQLV